MSQLLIREYTNTDAHALQTLMIELGYHLPKHDIIENIKNVQERGGRIFLAQSGDTIIGCVCAMIDARLAEGLYGEIVSLVVSENSRSQGIGKKLVKHAESWLKARVTKIRVRANTVRSDAHNFYESLGYSSVKDQKIFTKVM
ncbi:GNAT family N-acetyltransferase [Desulfosediminicola flagellatus]|uniref:GNAT family N-acetyltransferase n=1 Tax=Desulfosediminicola flagellatus TaxID=2569541 RepID=UPI0010ACA0F9|nr:GNAT family N-acetyltransferase [Desulfosediminicola flagellatus]